MKNKKFEVDSKLKFVERNQLIHDNNADYYNVIHNEIYNKYEQNRISDLLKRYVKKFKTRGYC